MAIYSLPWLRQHTALIRWALEHKPAYDYFGEPTGETVRCRSESDGPSLWAMARAANPRTAAWADLGWFRCRPAAVARRRRRRLRALWAWEGRREGWLRESRRRVREREAAVAADMAAVGL